MSFTKENDEEKPVFIIEDKPDVTTGQDESEVPIITIVRHISDELPNNGSGTNGNRYGWRWMAMSVVLTLLVCLCTFLGWEYYRTYINIGIPVSCTSEQNIEALQQPITDAVTPEVVMTSDSILGVAMNFYELRGLKAEISFTEPDSTDADVYMYSRCADYTTDVSSTNRYLGSLVANGKVVESDVSRLGYCAMVNDRIVIGVARDDKVKDYVARNGGSLFRQFVLVSSHMLPHEFHLHGKVERRGLGWIDNRLYYIETRYKETMWDFADALREYGFTDAIYITGGTDYSYYRTADGQAHGIGDISKYPHKHAVEVPWIVFRRR